MIELLTEPGNMPFSVALGVVALLAVLQLAGLGDLLGADLDADVDVGVDVDHDLAVDAGLLSLIGVGRIPFMMWLMILLSLFGVIGLAGQHFLEALTGAPWSAWLVSAGAALVALPATGAISRPLGRVLPKDETTAINVGALVGREAEVVIGTATPGNPARAKVTDHFGQVHYVMLEPDNADQRFVQNEKVLLVRREGELFKAIARGDHYLPKLD
ncbi:YqiJ family protein [Novosphingobium beihaiensis]|uniref:YqiJ family protein n=1 Tax=Novosphingobium beihaiensis TaxID=2930389 RepID=A0ABT0BP78_9SPHN|nr:YqiJ family protein [Novosphingobium beihaiensis]MCJ2186773.1 YqiJ family protein [Novosphingobium beihaiensis]